jgi:hypothetical protein
MVALLDFHARNGLAKAMCRQTIELAWATVGAVAVYKLTAMDRPVSIGHISLLDGYAPDCAPHGTGSKVTKTGSSQKPIYQADTSRDVAYWPVSTYCIATQFRS